MKPLVDKSTPMWHTLSVEDVCTHLESNPHGLASNEATRQLAQYGPNELKAAVPLWQSMREANFMCSTVGRRS